MDKDRLVLFCRLKKFVCYSCASPHLFFQKERWNKLPHMKFTRRISPPTLEVIYYQRLLSRLEKRRPRQVANGYVSADALKQCLSDCKSQHEKLENEIQDLLNSYHDDGKEPNPMAKGISWIKTNVKLALDESDPTIAELMTDGCNMGVKSLNQYLNQYKAADEKSKDIAKRLINLEEELAVEIRRYL